MFITCALLFMLWNFVRTSEKRLDTTLKDHKEERQEWHVARNKDNEEFNKARESDSVAIKHALEHLTRELQRNN